MKFRWIRYIAERLPKEIRERRKTEIEACFTGTKKQLEEKVMESLYEQVKIVVVATAIFLMILLLTIVMYLSQDRRILITRDETGGETTEKQIRIKTKKDDDIYSLTIRPKGYTKSQITDALDRGEKYLKEHLVAKNKSINEVSKHLEMPSKIQGENITVQWQSDDPAVIDEEGNVFSKNVKKDYIVNLNARMECQGEVRILKIPVCVVPGNSGKRVSEKQKIIADLKKQLEDAKEEAKDWEESWNMCREQVRALSRQSDIISMVLRMDDVELLDLAFGFVRGCYNQQIKKEQEAENNGEM